MRNNSTNDVSTKVEVLKLRQVPNLWRDVETSEAGKRSKIEVVMKSTREISIRKIDLRNSSTSIADNAPPITKVERYLERLSTSFPILSEEITFQLDEEYSTTVERSVPKLCQDSHILWRICFTEKTISMLKVTRDQVDKSPRHGGIGSIASSYSDVETSEAGKEVKIEWLDSDDEVDEGPN
nr:hypothetical protein Iba_chr07fCG1620 [Ipomoea batatas]